MKVIGIIPARFASSRFPGKPLIDLKGKSMIQRVYEGTIKSKLLSEVIVATDDMRIFEHVIAFGGKAMMTNLNHTTGTDRCCEVARTLEADVIVNIQGDEPLVDFRQIDQLIAAFEDGKTKIATLATEKINQEDIDNPNRIKLVVNHTNEALYFSRSSIPNVAHAKGAKFPFLRHIGLYAYRKETLLELAVLETCALEKSESLEQLRWLFYGFPIRIVFTEIETPNIDTPEDLIKVLTLL